MTNWQTTGHRQVGPPPQWAQGPAWPPAPQRTNGLAIMALVSVFVFGPLAVILGHAARHQIRRTGEAGAGMALGALLLGYVETAVMIAIIVTIATQYSGPYM
jgi:hypothetical protein